MDRKPRGFGLGDLMIVIAALGVGFVGVRPLWREHATGPGVVSTHQGGYNRLLVAAGLSACATPLTVACLILRIRRPRRAWRRVALLPGTAVLLACVVVFGARTLQVSASLASPDVYSLFGPPMATSSAVRFSDSVQLVLIRSRNSNGVIGSIEPMACHGIIVTSFASPCGTAVAAVWFLLAISGRWRPERSWIDRFGRGLGLLWIVIAILAGLPV